MKTVRTPRMARAFKIAALSSVSALALSLQAAQAQQQLALEEIVVTAQRRTENIQDIPLSITVVDPAKLEGLHSANEITQFVANTSAATYDGHVRPFWFVRGIGTGDTSPNTVQATGIYYDDVYMAPLVSNGFPVFDMQRVEVLKGPQGTLYGKNTTAGLVNFISKAPNTEAVEAYAKLDYGNFDAKGAEGVLNAPMFDGKVAGRLSVHYENRNSYYKNIGPVGRLRDLNELAVRGQLLGKFSDNSELLIKISARDYRDEGQIRFPEGVNAGGTNNFGYVPLVSRDTVIYNAPTQSDLDQKGVMVRYTQGLGDLNLVSITAYDEIKYEGFAESDYVPAEIARLHEVQKYNQASQELRLSNNVGSKVDWILGFHAYYEKIKSERARGALGGGPVAALYNNLFFAQKTESYAPFANATVHFGDRFKLTGGLRWTSETKDMDLTYLTSASPARFTSLENWWPIPSVLSTLSTAARQDEKRTWDSVGYEVSPQFEISDNARVYYRLARGFRAGGFSTGITNQTNVAVVRPETVVMHEIGLKSELLDGRLNFNASAYTMRYNDIQVSVTIATNAGVLSQLANAAKGKVDGAEIEMNVVPVENLTLSITGGYNRTKYTSVTTTTGDFTGNEFPRSPHWTGSFTAEYVADLGGSGKIIPTFHVNYRSSFFMFGNQQTNPVFQQPQYALVNLKLAYVTPDDHWKITGYMNNAFDRQYEHHRVIPANGMYSFAHGAPRTYGVSVSTTW